MDLELANFMSLTTLPLEHQFELSPEQFAELNYKFQLNESFEKDSELPKEHSAFLVSNGIQALSAIECYLANTILKKNKLLIKKEKGTKLKPIISTTLHLRVASFPNKQTMIIFRDEKKALKYFEYAKNQTPTLSANFYFSNSKGMIINDKKAMTKNFKVCFFGISRFVSLLNHKSIDSSQVKNLLFLDFDKNKETNAGDFEIMMDLYRTYGRGIEFTFISRRNQDETEKNLMEVIGDLVCIENN